MSQAISVLHGDFGRIALVELDRPTVMHAQKEAHLMVHIGGAGGTAALVSREIPVDAATAVAVNPWQEHGFRIEPPGGNFRGIAVYFSSEWFLLGREPRELAFEFGRPSIRATRQIADGARQVATALLQGETGSAVEDILFALIRDAYEQSWQKVRGARLADRAMAKYNDNRIRRSVSLMEENLGGGRGIDWIASEMSLSRTWFFKLFKRQTGVSPNMYFNALRVERAIDRLVNTDIPLGEISNDLGFSAQTGFTRFFTSNVGVSPSAYRRVAYSE